MKGKIKKLVALALATIMVLAMGITAFAVEGENPPVEPKDGKIVIENPIFNPSTVEGGDPVVRTYTAYKIFSVTTSTTQDGETTYGYKLDSSSKAYDSLAAMADKADEIAETLDDGTEITYEVKYGVKITSTAGIDKEGKPEYNVEISTKSAASTFAKYLQTLTMTGGIEGKLVGEKVEITIPAAEMGYYFVSTENGALANLTTASSETPVFIYDKNKAPEIEKKTTLTGDVEIGQKVPYTITGKVPSTAGYEEYIYTVTDKMGKGLTFENDLVVKVGGVVIYEKGAPTENAPEGGLIVEGAGVDKDGNKTHDFKVTFDMTKFTVEQAVEISYSATVNADATVIVEGTSNPLRNTARLEYSKDPNSSETEKNGPTSDVDLYTANVVINKVITGTTTPLDGAKFVLMKQKVDAAGQPVVDDEGQLVMEYYKYTVTKEATDTTPEEGKVTWVDNKTEATKATEVTTTDGTASFKGLADGTYYLVETEAPDGYNLLSAPQEVVVTHDTNKSGEIEDTEKVVIEQPAKVENSTGTTLPSTGGIGTTIFYVVGGILVVAAGVLLITKKRMSKHN